jgi:hypothetical protein
MVVSKRKKDNKEIAPPTPELKRYFPTGSFSKIKECECEKNRFL